MKKTRKALPVILLPYVLLFFIVCVTNDFLMETYFDNFIFVPMLLLIGTYIVIIVYTIILTVLNLSKQEKSIDILRLNAMIKVSHIPAYILIFALGLGFSLTILFIISGIFFILDLVTIFTSGIIGVSGLVNGRKECLFTKEEATIYSILQFVFCIDVIISVVIYLKSRKLVTD